VVGSVRARDHALRPGARGGRDVVRAPHLRRLREARRLGRRLEREALPWITALAFLVAAAVANAEGDLPATCSHLRKGAERAHNADMVLHAWAARHRLGALLGGAEGLTLVEESEAAMRAKGIHAPERYVAMLLPGRWP
jgi:hypothetical protein